MRERERLPGITVIVAAAAALLALAGCGGTQVGTPEEVIEKAMAAQESLKSVRMDLESEVDFNLPGGHRSSVVSYKGVFEQPGKWRLNVRTAGGKTEVIIIGDSAYIRLPGSDAWTEKKGGEYLEAGSSPGDVIVPEYLESATEVQMVDRKGDTYHLGFNLDVESYARQFDVPGVDPSDLKGRQAKMEVWILKDSLFIKKATMAFSGALGSDSGNVEMSMEVEFSEFNKPVTIEAPI